MYKAAFLGPKAENADELERLLLEVLRDHVFWRRNFHPGDPRLIEEKDKHTEAYSRMATHLRDELFQILAELKRGAPVYSPRQVAHMVSDPTMAAIVGYFSGMLYNQNNIVAEVSPETVRKEREYMAALARMIAYPAFVPERMRPEDAGAPLSWGHLCSGGTLANLEALWTVRNLKFFPPAVRLLTHSDPNFSFLSRLEVHPAGATPILLKDATTWQLLNLPVQDVIRLRGAIAAAIAAQSGRRIPFDENLPDVRTLGMAGFLSAYNDLFPDDPCRLPIVFISDAAHYCWVKHMDVTGLGAAALEKIPVDRHVRLDASELEPRLALALASQRPVLAVVSICGTTEEGAIDPLHEIESLRNTFAAKGLTFWHHADAAMGGYFASMLPKAPDGSFRPLDEADPAWADFTGEGAVVSPEVVRSIQAMARTDSVTIDPHKFGYVPYPAGAVLFSDHHVRDFVGYEAPYLASSAGEGFSGFLGRWTLEGSRPGAAAVSCYLSQAVLPLDESGHGHLMKNCIRAARNLAAALEAQFEDGPYMLRLLTEPDTAGFCFLVAPREVALGIGELNAFNRTIWEHMTVDGGDEIYRYDFMLSKTEMGFDRYRHLLDPLLAGVGTARRADSPASLLLLRAFVMNPLIEDWNRAPAAFAERFSKYLRGVAERVRPVPDRPHQDARSLEHSLN